MAVQLYGSHNESLYTMSQLQIDEVYELLHQAEQFSTGETWHPKKNKRLSLTCFSSLAQELDLVLKLLNGS